MMFRNVFLVVATGLLTTACANQQPASLNGLSQVFHDPGFAVQGKTRKDQVWISSTQETGIRVLGWARPKGVAGQRVTLAKTARKPVDSHILLPTPRVVHPAANKDAVGVTPPAPAHKPTLAERIRAMNERLRKLEGR